MIIRKVDAENDWNFGKGKADYAVDDQAIQQNVKTRLLSWVGDCFFAIQEGVDWKHRLDIGQDKALAQEMRSVILQAFGVTKVKTLDIIFDHTTRAFRVSYEIQTIFSPSFVETLNLLS